MRHNWIDGFDDYFDDISKCANCGMIVEVTDKQNWPECDQEASQ